MQSSRLAMKFAANLIIPIFGVLRPWEVIVEKAWGFLVFWLLLPFLLGMWLIFRNAGFDAMVVGALVWFGVILFYMAIWVSGSLKDAKRAARTVANVAGGLPQQRLFRTLLSILAVMVPLWPATFLFGVFAPMGDGRGTAFGDAHWWGYTHAFLLFGVAALLVILRRDQIANAKHNDTVPRLLLLAPLVGLQGLAYFSRRRVAIGIGFLAAGLVVAGLTAWVLTFRFISLEGFQFFWSMAILYVAPIFYLGLWLWTIADMDDSAMALQGASMDRDTAGERDATI